MNLIIFEDNIKYDPWVTVVLVLSLVLLVVLGLLFYVDAYDLDIFPRESAAESRTGAVALFASAALVLATYWLFLPRKIAVSQDGIIIKFGGFKWKISFETIKSINAAKGIIVWWAHSWITSYGSQIEIIRRHRLKIRISPTRRDQFLGYANKALADWKNTHPLNERS
jgi:hypothetical protein